MAERIHPVKKWILAQLLENQRAMTYAAKEIRRCTDGSTGRAAMYAFHQERKAHDELSSMLGSFELAMQITKPDQKENSDE